MAAPKLPRVRFTCVPNPWCDHPDSSPERNSVLRVLVQASGAGWECSLTRAELVERSKVGRDKVIDALKWLVSVGAIEIVTDYAVPAQRRFILLWRRASQDDPETRPRAGGRPEIRTGGRPGIRTGGALESGRGAPWNQGAPIEEVDSGKKKRDTVPSSVSPEVPASERAEAAPETGRDGSALASSESGPGPFIDPEPEPAPEQFKPTERDEAAKRLVEKLRGRGVTFNLQANDLVKLGVRHPTDEPPDPEERAELVRLKPEVVRYLRGWPKPGATPQARSPGRFKPAAGFPAIETARLLGRHAAGDPGAAQALADHLAGRYGDGDNAKTRAYYLDAVQQLSVDLVRASIEETEAEARTPARFLSAKFRRLLDPIRRRVEEKDRPPGDRTKLPRGSAEKLRPAYNLVQ